MAQDPIIARIAHWVTDQALTAAAPEKLVEGLCHRLNAAGVSIFRANIAIRPIHPVHGALAYRWHRQHGAEHEVFDRATLEATWVSSPFYHMHQTGESELRQRLSDTSEPDRFSMFRQLREQGATDYFAVSIGFEPGTDPTKINPNEPTNIIRCSWVSDTEDGFSDTDLAALRQVMSPLALALAAKTAQRISRDLMAIYLGADAGERVLSGEIGHGSVTSMRTAILYLDLAGFTALSERLPGADIIAMLNDYYSAIIPVIDQQGGQVLKFMGDGILAIFSEVGDGQSRLAAIDAVIRIREEMEQINARRAAGDLPVTSFNAAIHAGEVLYGNIGAPTRLDFTVIGPAVNAAARILGMCSALDQQILISAIVAKPALELRPALVSVGQYRLRGVSERQELFTLD